MSLRWYRLENDCLREIIYSCLWKGLTDFFFCSLFYCCVCVCAYECEQSRGDQTSGLFRTWTHCEINQSLTWWSVLLQIHLTDYVIHFTIFLRNNVLCEEERFLHTTVSKYSGIAHLRFYFEDVVVRPRIIFSPLMFISRPLEDLHWYCKLYSVRMQTLGFLPCWRKMPQLEKNFNRQTSYRHLISLGGINIS